MPIKQIIKSSRVPVKIWTNDVDEGSIRQLKNVADLPFVFHHVAAMPDVHVGMGATIGSVIATKGAVIPAAVGVDIGCGMAAVKLNLERNELTEKQLVAAFQAILRRTPVGLTQHREKNCRTEMCLPFADEMAEIEAKNPGILDPMQNMNWRLQMGTLGSGNHFIEIEIDEEDGVGKIEISGANKEVIDAAIRAIKAIVAVPEIGEVYEGKISSIMPYGAFVEFMPGKDGLLHISEIDWRRLETVEQAGLKEGDTITVKLVDIDPKTGKFKLSHRVLIPKPEGFEERAPRPNNRGGHGNGERNRGGERGPRRQ